MGIWSRIYEYEKEDAGVDVASLCESVAFLIIEDTEFGTGRMVPLELNPAQRIVHSVAEAQLKKRQHVRMVILKARRMGISTYVRGGCSIRPRRGRTECLYRDALRSATSSMFGMARGFGRTCPGD